MAAYFPEFHLSRWFREARGEDVTVWCFAKNGAQSLLADYRTLTAHLGVDAIVLIDGGVDSLSRGDEARMGTILEDGLSLSAVHQLAEVPLRLLACLGFGAEREVSHAHILENVADLTAYGAFLGSCSLVREMEPVRAYEAALDYLHAQPIQEPSIINASVLSAIRGHYGDFHLLKRTQGSRLWINPLMAMYWLFDLPAVAERSRFLSEIAWTETPEEALRSLMLWRQKITPRAATAVPPNWARPASDRITGDLRASGLPSSSPGDYSEDPPL